MNRIKNSDVEMTPSDFGEGVICSFCIYRKRNPEMFKENGDINKTKLKRLQIFVKEVQDE